MILRGIDFGHVFNSSGARGFAGEGYWFHQYWKSLGLNYEGSTFVSKTTTLNPRAGNMPLTSGLQPVDVIPKCIVVKPLKGVVLNSVGLSGPGAASLLSILDQAAGKNTKPLDSPFVLSFMAVGPTMHERLTEVDGFINLLKTCEFTKPGFAIQLNLSCPNTGHDTAKFAFENEILLTLAKFSAIDVPLLVKVNALFPIEVAMNVLETNPACDAIVVSNSIPWGALPDRIDWKKLFGSTKSPLAHLGGGGLSGKPLLPIVRDWIAYARQKGVDKPIIGGGGVLDSAGAEYLLAAGASAIELGSVSILRPWRVQGIIQHVNNWFDKRGTLR